MRVVHLNPKATFAENLEKAQALEEASKWKEAIPFYERCVALKPTQELAYNRLLILYRKEKLYKKELELLKAGINAFQKLYKTTKYISATRTIKQLSKALQRSTGLVDAKGNDLHEHEPIARWKKRELLLIKKLNL